jgi:parvulin-like peptidyl-prolyl isomerase
MRVMCKMYGRSFAALVVVFAVVGPVACTQSSGATSERAPAEPRSAASQPSSERVLMKLGDKATVTQADVEVFLRNSAPANRPALFSSALRNAINDKMMLLYLADHPDVVTQADLDKEIEASVKKARLKDADSLKKSLAVSGVTWEHFENMMRIRLLYAKLAAKGAAKGEDEAYRKKVFDEHPDYFNGAAVKVRHIMVAVPPTATPAERAARRAALVRIRDDLVSKRKSWDECLKQSTANTRTSGGLLGTLTRFFSPYEALVAQVWSLPVGEISDVIEAGPGYHIAEVLERTPGSRDFKDPHTTFQIKAYLQNQPLGEAMQEVVKKYPLIGVQPPDMAAIVALPAPATRPARTTRPTTRPSVRPTTRPGTRPTPAMRPPVRPGTRPSPMRGPHARPTTRPGSTAMPSTRPAGTVRPRPVVRPPAHPSAATQPTAAMPMPASRPS